LNVKSRKELAQFDLALARIINHEGHEGTRRQTSSGAPENHWQDILAISFPL
jgi:hypothetical protein